MESIREITLPGSDMKEWIIALRDDLKRSAVLGAPFPLKRIPLHIRTLSSSVIEAIESRKLNADKEAVLEIREGAFYNEGTVIDETFFDVYFKEIGLYVPKCVVIPYGVQQDSALLNLNFLNAGIFLAIDLHEIFDDYGERFLLKSISFDEAALMITLIEDLEGNLGKNLIIKVDLERSSYRMNMPFYKRAKSLFTIMASEGKCSGPGPSPPIHPPQDSYNHKATAKRDASGALQIPVVNISKPKIELTPNAPWPYVQRFSITLSRASDPSAEYTWQKTISFTEEVTPGEYKFDIKPTFDNTWGIVDVSCTIKYN